MELEAGKGQRGPDGLLLNVERLTNLTLNRIEEGSQEKLLSASEARLLSVVALRCMKLWRELRRDSLGDRKRGEEEFERLLEASEDQE